jgi:hypothetical protein
MRAGMFFGFFFFFFSPAIGRQWWHPMECASSGSRIALLMDD